jgi:hypothetical protein
MKLFAGDMWSVFNFGDPNERYQKFLARGRPPFKHLLEGVLLYDNVTLPTQDFLTLSVLVGVLGEDSVTDLVENGILDFIRIRGSLSYVGNGGGIKSYKITQQSGGQSAFCAPLEEAISWALSGLNVKLKNPHLKDVIAANTLELDADDIYDKVKHETYIDILNSDELRLKFGIRNKDMDNLAGVGPDGVRIYGGPDGSWQGDEIDIVMALAAANLELRLIETSSCNDASTAAPVGQMIKAKALRSFGREAAESFAEFREIADVPDIGEAILEKRISIRDLVKLARTRDAEQFRTWFHENCRTDVGNTAREYSRILKAVPAVQSFRGRGIRFMVTTLVGLLPGVGLIASAVDSFFLEKWLRGHSPKFFIDDLNTLMPAQVTGA